MARRIIDLSQPIATGMQVFPLHSPTHVLPWAKRETCGFASEAIFCNGHAGTHVDAPFHFFDEGPTVDQIPLDRFFGPAVVYDLCHKPPRSLITAEDLAACAEELSPAPDEIVLIRTGIDEKLGQPEYLRDYSGLSEDGARFLEQRGVKAVGTDAPGIDHPLAAACPAHHVLLPADILVYENLANLSLLIDAARGRRFSFYALPLKIQGGTGSPVRAMAVIDSA